MFHLCFETDILMPSHINLIHTNYSTYYTRSILIQKKRLINEQKWAKVWVRNSKPKGGKLKTCMELLKLKETPARIVSYNLCENLISQWLCMELFVRVCCYLCFVDTHTYAHTILTGIFPYPPSSVFLKWRKPISI